MAKTKISEFSSTPANNTDIDSINIAEGCAPSNINDAIRELMAQLKDFQIGSQGDSFNGPIGTSTAAAGAFTTLSASSTVTLSGGTANGVTYLNGSKVLTSGSALTFDGTSSLAIPASAAFLNLGVTTSYGAVSAAGTNPAAIYFNGATRTSYGSFLQYYATNHVFANETGGSEIMRLLNTGNVGIGTSSPAYKLDVVGSSRIGGDSPYLYIQDTVNPASDVGLYLGAPSAATYAGLLTNFASDQLLIRHNSATVATFNSAGNLGLGVTPSAWSEGRAIERRYAGTADWGYLQAESYRMTNAYYNGGWKYGGTGAACNYGQEGGAHKWYTASSGTAGNAISFTQAATLAADGSYYVGCTTTPDGTSGGSAFYTQSVGRRTLRVACTTSGGAGLAEFVNSNGLVGTISTSGSTTTYGTSSDYRLKNITGEITPQESGAYIDALKPKKGTWKADGSVFIGLIAHEVQEASRTPVATGTKDGDEMQAMDYSSAELIANLIAEIKFLRVRVAQLETN